MNTGFFSKGYLVACLQEVAFKQQCSVAINICMKGPNFRVWFLYFVKFAMANRVEFSKLMSRFHKEH